MLKNTAARFALALLIIAMLIIPSCSKKPQYSGYGTSLDVDMSSEALPHLSQTSPTASDAVPSSSVVESGTAQGSDNTSTEAGFVTLKHGDDSDTVLALQVRLAELKYLTAEPTGYYGDGTVAAVSAFQGDNALPVTGETDEATYNAIFAEDAKPCALALAGIVIGIDPGHQAHSNHEEEPVSPDSDVMGRKASSGIRGTQTGTPEYEIVLSVGLILRDMLEAQGATVIMTRESNDVDISSIARARIFNENEADYVLRLHCSGADDASLQGATVLMPSQNPFYEDCERAAGLLLDAFCDETGARRLGVVARDDQTCFNWCERMIMSLELGHLSNAEEEQKLINSEYQKTMARGILSGILAYYVY